jgi:hypothetical protein
LTNLPGWGTLARRQHDSGTLVEDTSMKNLTWTGLLACAMVLAAVSPALSHHSHAMYDLGKDVTVTGTVTQYTFRNPHVFLYIDTKSANGEVVNYWIEMSNIPNMIRRGIGQTTFKPGDKITANVHPLQDGRSGGSYVTVIAADGKTYD